MITSAGTVVRVVEPGHWSRTSSGFLKPLFLLDQSIKGLIPKLDPENLILELEKRDLYCPKCHYHVRKEYTKRVQSLRSAKVLRGTLASTS